jgi:hypothetical protein
MGPYKILYYIHVTVCFYVRHAYRIICAPVCIFPCLSQAEIINKYIQINCKILMLLLDQNFRFFRMVDLVFLLAESYMLKMHVECKHSFRE